MYGKNPGKKLIKDQPPVSYRSQLSVIVPSHPRELKFINVTLSEFQNTNPSLSPNGKIANEKVKFCI